MRKEEFAFKSLEKNISYSIDLWIYNLPLSFREVPLPSIYISARVVFNTISLAKTGSNSMKNPPFLERVRLSRYPYYPIHERATEKVRLHAPVCLCMRAYTTSSTLTFANVVLALIFRCFKCWKFTN